MLDKPQIEVLLQELPDRPARSRLEPYGELVLEMRRRNFSYRQIAKLLVERCGFDISHSAIHDFVRRHGATTTPAKSKPAEEQARAVTTSRSPEWRGTDSSIRDRIAALKRQKPASHLEEPFASIQPSRFTSKMSQPEFLHSSARYESPTAFGGRSVSVRLAFGRRQVGVGATFAERKANVRLTRTEQQPGAGHFAVH